MALDCLFAVWFVVGNVWIFGGHSSANDAPNLYRLCLVFLTFSCIGYAMPFILCTTICCCLPCIISVMGFREDLTQNRGATLESIDSLPIYKFKIKKTKSGSGDRENNSGAGEGGVVAAGTEKERAIAGEDAVHALNCGCIRVGVMFPTVEVRYKNLLVEAECEVVHGKPLPTLCNYFKRMLSAVPKPVLTLLDLSFPLASSDLGAENLENEFIFSNMHLCQIQRRIEEMAAAGEDTTSLDDEAFNMEAALDRCILRLIASCCNGDKLVRAIELVKLLSLEKSVRGAIKLVTALKLPNLAERFNTILEERLLKETTETTVIANTNLDASMKAADVVDTKTLTSPEILKESENIINPLSSEKLSFPLFKSAAKAGKEKSEQKQPAKLEDTTGVVKNLGGDSKSVGGEVKKGGEVNQIQQTHRPSNPFAKTTNNQEKSSLLDSLKKMKKTDGTGKR